MGLFSGIGSDKIKSQQGGVWFEPGLYLVKCSAVKMGVKREGNRPFFVAEFTIVESSNPKHIVGSTVSWMVMMDAYIETALGNIKGFAAGIWNVDEKTVDEAAVEAMVSKANPCNGLMVRAEATVIKTKKNDGFTKLKWTPYTTETTQAAV